MAKHPSEASDDERSDEDSEVAEMEIVMVDELSVISSNTDWLTSDYVLRISSLLWMNLAFS